MLGFTPFAKAPFAALGVAFVVSQSENTTVSETDVIAAQFAESITESISQILDVQSEQDNFFEGIVEGLSQQGPHPELFRQRHRDHIHAGRGCLSGSDGAAAAGITSRCAAVVAGGWLFA